MARDKREECGDRNEWKTGRMRELAWVWLPLIGRGRFFRVAGGGFAVQGDDLQEVDERTRLTRQVPNTDGSFSGAMWWSVQTSVNPTVPVPPFPLAQMYHKSGNITTLAHRANL